MNENLARAKRSRSEDSTKGKIDRQFRNLNLRKVFTCRLQPLTLKSISPGGKEKKINSFRIGYIIDETALKKQGYLDGVSCFLTNSQAMKPEQVILAYRRKNKVEEAFREIKSYLQVRPFNLTLEERIRAYVCICVLGYLLLKALEEELSHLEKPLSGPGSLIFKHLVNIYVKLGFKVCFPFQNKERKTFPFKAGIFFIKTNYLKQVWIFRNGKLSNY